MAECVWKLPLGVWEWERLQMCETHTKCVIVESSGGNTDDSEMKYLSKAEQLWLEMCKAHSQVIITFHN